MRAFIPGACAPQRSAAASGRTHWALGGVGWQDAELEGIPALAGRRQVLTLQLAVFGLAVCADATQVDAEVAAAPAAPHVDEVAADGNDAACDAAYARNALAAAVAAAVAAVAADDAARQDGTATARASPALPGAAHGAEAAAAMAHVVIHAMTVGRAHGQGYPAGASSVMMCAPFRRHGSADDDTPARVHVDGEAGARPSVADTDFGDAAAVAVAEMEDPNLHRFV